MLEIFINLTRYFFIIISFYFLFSSYKLHKALYSENIENRNFYFKANRITIILSHLVGFIILFLTKENQLDIVILYIEELMFFLIVWFIISKYHYNTNLLLWNIVLYFLQIGFIVLTRLDYGYGVRHFRMSLLGFAIALIIPRIFYRLKFLSNLSFLYIILSFIFLLLANETRYGSKNWFSIGGFSFQPSEFVKVFLILFIASYFNKGYNKYKILISGLLTGALIIILVLQKDLGTALMFTILYITLIYIKTNNPFIFLGGLLGGSLASFIGYKLFSHVRVRVEAWSNPWQDIDNKGYQITQSLFAIGAGKWIGTGLTKGLPYKIPVVMTDFVFSAISEEFGNIFSIFLIVTIMIFFLVSIKPLENINDNFLILVSSGISIVFALQQILIIGGVIKFIPLTGVTLPFISYGGTSLITSCTMVGLLQGVYLNRTVVSEDEDNERLKEK